MRAGVLAVGNFTAIGVRQAIYMLISLSIGMSIREFARAWTATRLHDPTPRLWGRLTLNPKAWFEPFGSRPAPGVDGDPVGGGGVRHPRRLREAGAGRPQLFPQDHP